MPILHDPTDPENYLFSDFPGKPSFVGEILGSVVFDILHAVACVLLAMCGVGLFRLFLGTEVIT